MKEIQENSQIPPSEEISPQPEAEKPVLPPKPKRSPWTTLIAVLALLIALASAAAWAYSWLQYQTLQAKSHEKLMQLEKIVTAQSNTLAAQHTQLENTRQSVQKLDLQLQEQNKPKDWLLAEVANQVKLAALNLRVDSNVPLAQKLLQDADQQLAVANNATLLPVRQALANDMAALAAAPQVDIPGVIVKLNALKQVIEQLPQTPKNLKPEPQTNLAAVNPTTTPAVSWRDKGKELLARIWQSLKELVVIRNEGAQSAPLLPPTAFAFVVTNIQAQLSMAQWAALHQQGQIYRQSIAQASSWINRYFALDDAKVKAAQDLLNSLATINVNPTLPDLSQSLQTIQKLLVSNAQ